MGASLGRASTVLKHSNAGMAYPKSSLRAGRRRRTRFRNQHASARAKNKNRALAIRPAGPAKEAAAFGREEFRLGLTAGSSTGAPPTSRRTTGMPAACGARFRNPLRARNRGSWLLAPPLYLWTRVERRWRNGSGEGSGEEAEKEAVALASGRRLRQTRGEWEI